MKSLRRLLIAAAVGLVCGAAQAQTTAGLSESAKALVDVGTWEFSNAERDKICSVTFGTGAIRTGIMRLTFDADCVKLFPLVQNIVGWKFPQDDLLYLLDARGRAVIQFSEVEDGIFESPTPGVGLLFLQNPAAAGPPPKAADEMIGNWLMVRGDGQAICMMTLSKETKDTGFALVLKPGCAAEIVALNFTEWRAEGGELVLVPAEGLPWRFEDVDGRFRLLSETGQPISLVKQ